MSAKNSCYSTQRKKLLLAHASLIESGAVAVVSAADFPPDKYSGWYSRQT